MPDGYDPPPALTTGSTRLSTATGRCRLKCALVGFTIRPPSVFEEDRGGRQVFRSETGAHDMGVAKHREFVVAWARFTSACYIGYGANSSQLPIQQPYCVGDARGNPEAGLDDVDDGEDAQRGHRADRTKSGNRFGPNVPALITNCFTLAHFRQRRVSPQPKSNIVANRRASAVATKYCGCAFEGLLASPPPSPSPVTGFSPLPESPTMLKTTA